MVRVGDIFYECFATDGDAAIMWSEWRVRTIRGGKITAVLVAPWTRGKRSKRNGDFGWLDPIAQEWRRTWRADNSPPDRLSRTRLQAIRKEITAIKRFAHPEDYDDPGAIPDLLKRLRSMETRERNKRRRRPR